MRFMKIPAWRSEEITTDKNYLIYGNIDVKTVQKGCKNEISFYHSFIVIILCDINDNRQRLAFFELPHPYG